MVANTTHSSGNLASSSATAATASSSNGHNKGASASSSASHNHHHRHGSSSGGGGAFGTESFATISSPARRSEVSPIQCHVSVIASRLRHARVFSFCLSMGVISMRVVAYQCEIVGFRSKVYGTKCTSISNSYTRIVIYIYVKFESYFYTSLMSLITQPTL